MSTPARPSSRAQERFYVGRRVEQTEVYAVSLDDVERLAPPAGDARGLLDWGPGADRGGGTLATVLLCHMTGRRAPRPACSRFREEIITSLPVEGFVIGCDDIALWLVVSELDPRMWRRAKRRGLRRLARRATRSRMDVDAVTRPGGTA